jgi:hypothetical protein
MKFFVSVILTALLAFAAGLFLPWWGIAIAAFLVALLIHQRGGSSWFAGFLGLFLLWGGLAFWINMKNLGILAERVANVLPLGGNPIVLILVTGFIGGLVGGFAALSASFLRSPKKYLIE